MPSTVFSFKSAAIILSLAFLASCVSSPFSYSEDRCLGSYNQCRNSCKDMPFGGAQSACYDRCLTRESQCYASGDDGAGSSLSQESLIGRSRAEAEKEEGYQRWKAQKEKERAEAEKAGEDKSE